MLPARWLCLVPTVLAAVGLSRGQLPDLVIDDERLGQGWYVEDRYFPPRDCAIAEGCVAASGVRKLLRFDVWTANVSMTHLALGNPQSSPLFQFSPCHGHYHFEDYADYRLEDFLGTQVAPGHKQAFCLLDSIRYLGDPWVPLTPRFHCGDQGIQGGWADVYSADLDCQWIDVTDVPNGPYVLRVDINPAQVLAELDYANNSGTAFVEVTDAPGVAHRPDGRVVPGEPVRVGREAGQERVTYDVSSCPVSEYQLLYSLSGFSVLRYDGSICALGTSGDVLVTLPDPLPGQLLWFTVVGFEPLLQREGGHGFDSDGRPRGLSGVGRCGVAETVAKVHCSD